MNERNHRPHIAVVGGGAAGMMAAGTAGENGAAVTLFEQNTELGKKLLITGKGRCNLTNQCGEREFLEHVVRHPRFLYSAIYAFPPARTISFFEQLGCPCKTERGQRVFPVSDRAVDVRNALERYLMQNQVQRVHEKVCGIVAQKGVVRGVQTTTGFFSCDAVILATGGLSYPGTGSTGDGYAFARSLGHTVTPTFPSLVPLEIEGNDCARMQGLSLKNTALRVRDISDGREIYRDFGEMLFTHFGVSGPMVLSASAHLDPQHVQTYRLELDLKPALDEKMLDHRLLADFSAGKNRDLINIMSGLLPHKMIDVFLDRCGIDPHKKVHDITKLERRAMCTHLKHFSLQVKGFRPVREAIITAGGVDVGQIDPKTMSSRLVQGLYFAGEMIDTDAYTGGFNLQIAFATGFLAGRAAAQMFQG
ncbi:MAG: NAD(P)/FAD-dependent oxidoreductase [Clostridiales bacterium]|nr:NAD(P)/FAD-dependent oxidoreductase [Clostridiales bacterium]